MRIQAVLSLALVVGCSASPNASWAGDVQSWSSGRAIEAGSVLAELEAYYTDLSARDWEAFADHFWPGARMATVWAPPGSAGPEVKLTTIPEFVAMAPEGPDSATVFAEWMTHAEVREAGILAEAWVRYEAHFGEPGELMEWSGVDSITLLFHGGRWRIVSLAYAADH